MNTNKTEHVCFRREGAITTLNSGALKLVNKLTYQGSSVSSTESDVNIRLANSLTAIDKLLVIWKSDLSDRIKRDDFQAAVVSVLLYTGTTWTLTKRREKKNRRELHKNATSYVE